MQQPINNAQSTAACFSLFFQTLNHSILEGNRAEKSALPRIAT